MESEPLHVFLFTTKTQSDLKGGRTEEIAIACFEDWLGLAVAAAAAVAEDEVAVFLCTKSFTNMEM